jgi:hypothetical protein
MIEGAITSDTSVNFYQTTRRNNPEDSHFHTRRRENLKSQEAENTSTSQLHYVESPKLLRQGSVLIIKLVVLLLVGRTDKTVVITFLHFLSQNK